MIRRGICASFFLLSFSVFADVLLPLSTLRVQGLYHCWAYVVAYTLESRSLSRDGIEVFIDIEKDLDYWVNYQRLKEVYLRKIRFSDKKDKDGNLVGIGSRSGVGFEFWRLAFEQGLFIHQTRLAANKEPLYSRTENYTSSVSYLYTYPFQNGFNFDFVSLASVEARLLNKDLRWSEAEAMIHEGLKAFYGYENIPSVISNTAWLGSTISTKESLSKILGSDRENIRLYDWISIGPSHWNEKTWTRDNFRSSWHYSLPKKEYPALIRESLDQGWPIGVVLSGGFILHITPVIGYVSEPQPGGGTKYRYALAYGMGAPAMITWETEESLLKDLTSLEGLYPALQRRISPYPGRL